MATTMKSISELYDDFKNQVQSDDDSLTDWNEGSILDILDGVISNAVSEVQRIAIDQFAKTFVETANGPEVTGDTDDLQTLLVDHFGDEFARPAAAQSEGIITFSRPTTGAGNVIIPVGTIVKTAPDASGVAQRFATTLQVTLTGLTINASIQAVLAGSSGNAAAEAINILESTLTDASITVLNDDAMSGGTNEANDSEYREFARNLLVSVRGATLESIEAAARTVPGVVTAVGIEFSQRVIQYDEASASTIGDSFLISRNKLYIADANGTANDALLAAVKAAIDPIRATGIQIELIGSSASTVNVSVLLTFNAMGPNYASLSVDPQPVLDDIRFFMQELLIGDDFIRADLHTYIMSIWGAAGSDDLTAMTITVPVGDVSADIDEKILPGTIEVA